MSGRLGRNLLLLGVAAAVAAAAWLGFDRWVAGTRLPALQPDASVEVLARDGRLLRAFTVADGRWRLRVTSADVDPDYIRMLLAYEDRRFYEHGGVDVAALGRAAFGLLTTGHRVSGGSTLTMQVARLLEDGATGSWAGKLRQVRVALALERRLSKAEVLDLYLNLAPMGGNLEGVRAGALAWFGKEPRRLTAAEAALLVALPQAPASRAPDDQPANARLARDRVLDVAARQGLLPPEELRASTREALPTSRRPFPNLAPQLADRLRAEAPSAKAHSTTVDADLQAGLEAVARGALVNLPPHVTVAILVADLASGEVLASVGAAEYGNGASGGFLDMTQASRSPGSTLKPLIYGLAFSDGILHPETLMNDRPEDYGGYAPQNFDGYFRGPVTAREALQASLNLPVVAITQALGPARLVAALRRAGVMAAVPGDAPGLAVALGGVGVSLEGLVQLYTAIAGGGEARTLTVRGDATGPAPLAPRLLSPEAAWQVAEVLAGTPRPAGLPERRLAVKTGTSSGNRDALALGFDGAHVVGVWVGRPDGSAVPGMSGAYAATPILYQAFARLGRATPLPPAPRGVLPATTNSDLPPHLRQFGERQVQTDDAPQLTFPPDGAVLTPLPTGLAARVERGTAPFTWFANGAPILQESFDRAVRLELPGPGFVTLAVVDAAGRSARVAVEVR